MYNGRFALIIQSELEAGGPCDALHHPPLPEHHRRPPKVFFPWKMQIQRNVTVVLSRVFWNLLDSKWFQVIPDDSKSSTTQPGFLHEQNPLESDWNHLESQPDRRMMSAWIDDCCWNPLGIVSLACYRTVMMMMTMMFGANKSLWAAPFE